VARLADGWFASFVTPKNLPRASKIAAFAVAYGRENDAIEAGSILFCHVDADGQKARRDFTSFSLTTHAVHLS
jgi:alkanesulfonate monooxygenase SsuD/methylene tetrahydromethanopterin reductase-like flavin-dependent oxidoreductase (luciferase family)